MRKTLERVLAGAALAAVATAFGACSGGGSSDKTPTAGPAGAQTSAATAPASSASAGAPNSKLGDLASKFTKSTFHATYKATGTESGGLTGEVQLYKDADKRLRLDATVTQDSQPLQVSFIQTDALSVLCLKDAGALGALLGLQPGEGACLKNDTSDSSNPIGDLNSLFSDLENADAAAVETSTRKIAGKDTTCFQSADSSTGNATTACFTDDGVLMYSKQEGDSPVELEATDVSGSVSSGDFDLPYEVRELPTPAP
jgi:hypothetical protein